jgi:hypothetical protein
MFDAAANAISQAVNDMFGSNTDANGSSDPTVALSDDPLCATGR